jgi:hypothetical protein
MGFELGLLKFVFLLGGSHFVGCYCVLQELTEARKKRRKAYYTLEHVGIVYLVIYI